jgi:ribonuclease HI
MRFIQINLHKSIAATATLKQRFLASEFDVALIQEPYQRNNVVSGLNMREGNIVCFSKKNRPRSCVLIKKGIKFIPLLEYCDGDTTTVEVSIKELNGNLLKLIVCSTYMPYDCALSPPGECVEKLVNFCKVNNNHLVVGGDANSHNVCWGSSDNNSRGNHLMDFLLSKNLEILNVGNDPTFIIANRKEVIDITFSTSFIKSKIYNWHVSDDISLSDHQYIKFELKSLKMQKETFRNPRKTNWALYKIMLKDFMDKTYSIENVNDMDRISKSLQESIVHAYHESCKLRVKISNRKCSWFTSHLLKQRKEARKLWNRAKSFIKAKIFDNEIVIKYKNALTHYHNEVKKAKIESWKKKCDEINCTSEFSRMHKVLSKSNFGCSALGTIKNINGVYAKSMDESLSTLLTTHFPGAIRIDIDVMENEEEITFEDSDSLAMEIVNDEALYWAVHSFEDYKAPGADKIFPKLLKEGFNELKLCLLSLFRGSIKLGYIPKVWREVDVKFIPKPGKEDYSEAKSFRPISLMSFILKALEKMIDKYIRVEYIPLKPFHSNQFAYQPLRSCEAALHHFISRVEKTFEFREFGLAGFLDIEGAFNNICYNSIVKSAESFGISRTLINWIFQMLNSRKVNATANDFTVSVKTVKGCPQGGCISCLLWLLVINELLCELNSVGGIYAQGFADDIIIYVSGKFIGTVTNIMQQALSITERWCIKNGLSVNAGKTIIIPFSKRRMKSDLVAFNIFNEKIPFGEETKYLGVIIDSKLNWNSHLQYVKDKAIRSFWMCKKLVGNNWGLQPRIIHWMYMQIIVPRITYGSIVWWKKAQQANAIKTLNTLQRMALLAITGAFKSSPSASLEVMLDIRPLHIKIKSVATAAAFRLASTNLLCNLSHSNELFKEMRFYRHLWSNSDMAFPTYNFHRKFSVEIQDREDIDVLDLQESNDEHFIYTDGSKSEVGVGCGIFCHSLGINVSYKIDDNSTVYQSEIFAIQVAANECLRKELVGKKLVFCSDSKAALNALKSVKINSKLVLNCFGQLQALGENNLIVLKWIPAHYGFRGNETADSLAKMGAEKALIDHALSTTFTAFKSLLFQRNALEHEKYWLSLPGQATSKKLLVKLDGKRAKDVLCLRKSEIRMVSGCFTGHNLLNYHLSKIVMGSTTQCRFCNADEETCEHLLMDCPELAEERLNIFGGIFNSITEIKLEKIINFLKLLNIAI